MSEGIVKGMNIVVAVDTFCIDIKFDVFCAGTFGKPDISELLMITRRGLRQVICWGFGGTDSNILL